MEGEGVVTPGRSKELLEAKARSAVELQFNSKKEGGGSETQSI